MSYTHLPIAQNQSADALATLASMIDVPEGVVVCLLLVETRGANETRQLASYSDSTRSKLDSCELDSKC